MHRNNLLRCAHRTEAQYIQRILLFNNIPIVNFSGKNKPTKLLSLMKINHVFTPIKKTLVTIASYAMVTTN